MKTFIFVMVFFFFEILSVYPQSSGSLAEEFAKLDEYIRNQKLSTEERKKIFEANVMNSLRTTLAHKFANPKKELKDLKFQDVQTERPEGTNNLFIKYKNYFISYSFVADPEKFLTSPIEEKVLEKPIGADLNSTHTDEKQSTLAK